MDSQTDRLPLTPTQIANWRSTFPAMAFFSDEQVQVMRDVMQSRINSRPDTDQPEVTVTPK